VLGKQQQQLWSSSGAPSAATAFLESAKPATKLPYTAMPACRSVPSGSGVLAVSTGSWIVYMPVPWLAAAL
jgi:hypothetical protein